MALCMKALVAKPNDVSSSLGTHVIGEHRLLKIVPSSTHSFEYVCAHMNKYIILKNYWRFQKSFFMLIIYL